MFAFVNKRKRLRIISYKINLNKVISKILLSLNYFCKYEVEDLCSYIKSNPAIIIGDSSWYFNLNFNEVPHTTLESNIHEVKLYLDKVTKLNTVILASISKLNNKYLINYHTFESIKPDVVSVCDLRKVFIDTILRDI